MKRKIHFMGINVSLHKGFDSERPAEKYSLCALRELSGHF